jgi:Fur family ferric uptake transcriptional regulator
MVAKDQEILQKILKEGGYSTTKARTLVCEALWDSEPQTMQQLSDKLHGKIDRASLYRTIDLFEKLGLVNRIYIGWKYKLELSDALTHHHHHISCMQCGRIIAIHEEAEIEQLIEKIASSHGIHAKQHQLEIQGVCQDCQAAA